MITVSLIETNLVSIHWICVFIAWLIQLIKISRNLIAIYPWKLVEHPQISLHKKKFSIKDFFSKRISSGKCGFGHIYWRNPWWETSFFVQCLSKAFDRVWYEGLLFKIQGLEVRSNLCKFLVSFVVPILLVVQNEFTPVRTEVLHEFILEPLNFFICINYISTGFSSFAIICLFFLLIIRWYGFSFYFNMTIFSIIHDKDKTAKWSKWWSPKMANCSRKGKMFFGKTRYYKTSSGAYILRKSSKLQHPPSKFYKIKVKSV